MGLSMSTAIANSQYDPLSQTLTVAFTDGTVYEYYGVPLPVFVAIQSSASSKGGYFNRDIRKEYSYSKIG
jgi:hypothetical protein